MQVSVETTGGLERKMTVALPSDQLESEVSKRLKSMAPRVKLAGFRPGKVPFKVVEQRYGFQVRQEVLGDIMSSSFYEAVEKEKLRPAGMPKIEPKVDAPQNEISYVATFEVYPEIEVKNLNKMKVERPKADIADTDIDKMIDKLRQQRAGWEIVERAAVNGDRVSVDYKGTINGEVFQGGEGSDLPVVLGSGSMIEGFEEALAGAVAGQDVEVDLNFPENYASAEVAGKPAHFSLKVKKVEAPVLPEVNDEFANQFGVKEGGIEGLRADVRKNMQRELDRIISSKLKNQVMDGLLAATDFETPSALIDEEAKRYKEQMGAQYGGAQNIPDDVAKVAAKRRVALGLILAELIRQNDMKADAGRIKAEVESIASAYGEPEDVIKWYYSNQQRMQEVESMVLEDQVVDWVLEQAQVTDKMTTFDELTSAA